MIDDRPRLRSFPLPTGNLCTLEEVENQIFEKEGVRVVFRADVDRRAWRPYTYDRALGKNYAMSVLHERIRAYIGEIEYVVVDGRGKIIHDTDISIGVVRSSYR